MTVTDTPIAAASYPPAPLIDQLKGFIGDLARPFSLIAISGCCGAGLLLPAVTSDKLGLALGALAAMYGAKAWETRAVAKSGADVEMAKAQATTPGAPA